MGRRVAERFRLLGPRAVRLRPARRPSAPRLGRPVRGRHPGGQSLEAQPGDLLFFEPGRMGAPPGKPGHVAIYVGNGQMIDAPETGETVQVQPVPCAATGDPEDHGAPRGVGEAGGAAAVTTGSSARASRWARSPYRRSTQVSSNRPPPAAAHRPACWPRSSSTSRALSPMLCPRPEQKELPSSCPPLRAANGVDPFDPSSAIPGAADLLAQFHYAFGSWTDAVAAYAAGGGAVEAARRCAARTGARPPTSPRPSPKPGWHRDHDKVRHPRRPGPVPGRPSCQADCRQRRGSGTGAKAILRHVRSGSRNAGSPT